MELYYTKEELRRPTKASLLQSVLPNKIHFRYCWLFSGIPADYGGVADPLTGREYVERNRMMMTGHLPDTRDMPCGPVVTGTMKAFWLTSDGKLVYVTNMSDDVKFRMIRARNLSLALASWTVNPELCEPAMRSAAAAYSNLIQICTDARVCSSGRFYNLYATYPLPVKEHAVAGDTDVCHEHDVSAVEIYHGGHLADHLREMYETYFVFMSDNTTSSQLRDRVRKLEAGWLVDHDRNETAFTMLVKGNWWTRLCVRLAMLISIR